VGAELTRSVSVHTWFEGMCKGASVRHASRSQVRKSWQLHFCGSPQEVVGRKRLVEPGWMTAGPTLEDLG
jgi:hypothetical protein